MSDMSNWDPQFVAERAFERWCFLDGGAPPEWTIEEWREWDTLGQELLELKNRLEWLGLYRGPQGAS